MIWGQCCSNSVQARQLGDPIDNLRLPHEHLRLCTGSMLLAQPHRLSTMPGMATSSRSLVCGRCPSGRRAMMFHPLPLKILSVLRCSLNRGFLNVQHIGEAASACCVVRSGIADCCACEGPSSPRSGSSEPELVLCCMLSEIAKTLQPKVSSYFCKSAMLWCLSTGCL
jgi:hypothetical protein